MKNETLSSCDLLTIFPKACSQYNELAFLLVPIVAAVVEGDMRSASCSPHLQSISEEPRWFGKLGVFVEMHWSQNCYLQTNGLSRTSSRKTVLSLLGHKSILDIERRGTRR